VAGHPPRGNIYYQLAKLYEEAGDGEKANQQMVELAKFAVEDGECRKRIARYAIEKKDPKLALKYLDELMFVDPFEPQYHKLLAQAAAQAGEHDLAIRENLLLLEFPDTNPRQVRMALARAYLAKGDKAKAAEEAKRVLKIDPEHGEAKEVLRKAEEK
jgi:Tfp pilus assembly protein PilF